MAALITKQELIDNNTKLEKKLILINSSLYEKDAFEYLLQLVTDDGAMAFISDTHRIWAQGQYYAGDLFSDKFEYWASAAILDEEDNIAKEIIVSRNKSIMKYKSQDNVTLDINKDTDNDAVLTIGYDINNSIDKTVLTMDSDSYYHLGLNDKNQIKIIKYTPIKVIASGLSILEFDNGDTQVSFNLTVTGTDPMTALNITTSDSECVIEDYTIESRKITATVKDNTTTIFTINYSDGTTNGTTTITQDWGYGVFYGVYVNDTNLMLENNMETMILNLPNKYITKSLTTKQFTITQAVNKYGWFACPSAWKVKFTDTSTNLQGGWQKIIKFYHYASQTEYQVWRTDNDGLGTVKWSVSL